MTSGPWFITPHAVRRYIDRIRPGISYERALRDLIDQSEAAHAVKWIDDGVLLFRGPPPRRLRFRVAMGGEGKPQLLTVLNTFDRP